MPIGQSFDETSAYYDSWVKKSIPGYEELFTAAVEVIPFAPESPIDVLDLGAGTGLFSQYVVSRYFRATCVLYDLAEKLLEAAQKRFQGRDGQFCFVKGDYREITGLEQYDLIISSLSIHHLEDEDKQRLFTNIHQLLRKPGVFINVDQIRGETPDLQKLYWEQ